MADALITKLSNLPQLTIRPTDAVRKYTTLDPDPQAAGRELRVDAVLAGGVQRADHRLRVTVQLVRVRDGSALWAQTFDQEWSDIFAMQDAIAEKVARALTLRLSGEEQTLLRKRDTYSAAANAQYMLGRHFSSQRTAHGLTKSIESFKGAIELDPRYALAHAGLADAYVLATNQGILRGQEAYPAAKAAAVKALELDERLAAAHTTLAIVDLYYYWDWSRAQQEFKRAIELKPDDATAHQRYALALAWRARFDEALREIRLARELDPVSLTIHDNLGEILCDARRYDEALEEVRKSLEMNPNFAQAHRLLGRVYRQKGMYEQAIAAYEKAMLLGALDVNMKAALAHTNAVSGRVDEARKLLIELIDLSARRFVSPFRIAMVYVGLGEKDQAFEWLERSAQERERNVQSLKVNPDLDPLRSDPRFAELMSRIGLSDPQ